MPLRPLQRTAPAGLLCQHRWSTWHPAQNYQALGIFTAAGTGKCFLFRDAVHRAARKATVLISLVQGSGTADNCLAWGSPGSAAQCCRRKVKEGDQMVSSNDSYKTPCRLCHTAALSPNKQLSHTATPLDSGSCFCSRCWRASPNLLVQVRVFAGCCPCCRHSRKAREGSCSQDIYDGADYFEL